MSDVQRLLARMAEQRAFWVDLPVGKRVKLLRPPEVELPRLIGGIRLEHMTEYAVDWSGFSEADLLGSTVGSTDALPFHPEIWAAYLADHAELLKPVAERMRTEIDDYMKRRAELAKNSAPSST